MDIGEEELRSRIFGPAPDAAIGLPGQQTSAQTRSVAQQDPFGSVMRDQVVQRPTIPAADRQRADYLVNQIAALFRNTNITASLPAHAAPMLWSDPVDLSGQVSLGAGVSGYQTVLSFTAPDGRWARIDGYGVDVDGGYTYDGSILWRIRLNGQNVQSLYDWGEHRGTIIQPRKTIIVVPQGQTVDFQVRRAVASGGANLVTMAMVGWTWRLRRNDEGTKAAITAY